VLSAPTYGVVAHHGDVRAYRGGPPGFWEYVNREPTATVTVQRYTEQLDGGELLAERTQYLSTTRQRGERFGDGFVVKRRQRWLKRS